MKIEIDDLTRPAVHALLEEHLANMRTLSPADSVHALDLGALRQPDISFWSAWDGTTLARLRRTQGTRPHARRDQVHAHVAGGPRARGRPVLLTHIIAVARARGYTRLSLETGAMTAFKPAHRLYERNGFGYCGPFGAYVEDPHSVFMTLAL